MANDAVNLFCLSQISGLKKIYIYFDCVSELRLLLDRCGLGQGRKNKDQVHYRHEMSPPECSLVTSTTLTHTHTHLLSSAPTGASQTFLLSSPFTFHCTPPSSCVVPRGTRVPYQPHSKQTAAGSGEAPWDTPRGGKEGEGSQKESRGEREREK